MAGRRIVIEFLGKVDQSLNRAINDTDSKVNKLSGRMNKVGNVAGKVLAGGLLLGGAAAVKAGNAAVADEAAQSKLEQTLRKAAGASDSQVAATEKWIEAQGKALGVSDDELRPALGRLAVATGDVGEAQKLSSLAMDISAGSGKSLESVSGALAKAANGNVGALGRLGIQTKDADGKTKSLHQITKDLAGTYGGAASKAAETNAGKQKILQTRMDELQEKIGAKLLPVFGDLTEKGLAMIDWVDKNQKLVGILAGVLGGLVGTLWAVSQVIKVVTAVQAALNFVMAANPIGLVVLAIAALVGGFIIAYKKSETFRKIVDGAFKAVATAAKFMWEKVLKPTFRFLITAWLNVAGWILNGAAKAFGWVPKIGPKLKAAAEKFNDFKKDVNRELDGVKDKTVKIKVTGAQAAINAATALGEALEGLPFGVGTAFEYRPKNGRVGRNADGTRHWRGGLTSLHERGGEIVDLPRGTRIYPAGRSAQMARQGGQAPVIININGALDPNAVGRQVEQILTRYQRSTGRPLQFATK